MHRLEREQWIERPVDEVFAFFADAANLQRITPPWLGFRILTPLPIEMKNGTLIDYSIKLAGVPMRWCSEIQSWNPPYAFIDIQRSGPYRRWVHLHSFERRDGGTLMTDIVDYRLPLGPLGKLVHGLSVRRTLSAIFDYRNRVVGETFTPHFSR